MLDQLNKSFDEIYNLQITIRNKHHTYQDEENKEDAQAELDNMFVVYKDAYKKFKSALIEAGKEYYCNIYGGNITNIKPFNIEEGINAIHKYGVGNRSINYIIFSEK